MGSLFSFYHSKSPYFLKYLCFYLFIFIEFVLPLKAIGLHLLSNDLYFKYYSKSISSNQSSHVFVDKKSILTSYGPLTLDINNIHFNSNIFFVPSLNDSNKPFFLAINCDSSLFNVKGPNQWIGWFKPFFNYELRILDDFCSN